MSARRGWKSGVGKALQAQAREAIVAVSRGFFDVEDNRLEPCEETLQTVYGYSLIVVFRLLSVNFADSRGLLKEALFDRERYPFFDKYELCDAHLARAMDLLARMSDEKTGRREFVDYVELDARYLGAIYEDLLEYELRCADEDGRGACGEFYLERNEGRRLAKGSYYTPQHVVEYIVERTVGAALEELRRGYVDDDGGYANRDELVERVLELRVVDPAMGSGHFLVEVAEYISRFLVEISSEADVDDEPEKDLRHWREEVVQRCIYGVDIDPLAVELAKVTLWLKTEKGDTTPSVLAGHLRCGNPLIGARISRRSASSSQLGGVDSLDVSILRRLADAVTAREFGLEVDAGFFDEFVTRLRDGTWSSVPRCVEVMDEVEAIAEKWRFFHWELEFSEVFFSKEEKSLRGEAGFDAVVGNPPYINANELNRVLSGYEKPYWKQVFTAARGAYDIYILFIELSLRMCRQDGYVGLITPNKFLSAPYAEALRDWLYESHGVLHFYDLSAASVFSSASIYPVISVFRKGIAHDEEELSVSRWRLGQSPQRHHLPSSALDLLPERIWGFLLRQGAQIVAKVTENTSTLGECAKVVASTTAAEADAYGDAIVEESELASDGGVRIVNTGSIDPFRPLWGVKSMRHQGREFVRPVLDINSENVPRRRIEQYEQPKLIFAKVALRPEAVVDIGGDFASMNTNFAIGSPRVVRLLGAICNSRLMAWIYERYFGGLRMSGGYLQFQAPQLSVLPIPEVVEKFVEESAKPGSKLNGYPMCRQLVELVDELNGFWAEWNELVVAFDPFKCFERGTPMTTFEEAFSEERKYFESVANLGSVKHDVDGLALERGRECWKVRVQLKKRKERGRDEIWRDWLRDDDGIVRQWVTAYRIPCSRIDERKALYYREAFAVLDEFDNFTSFPTAPTRFTQRDLGLAKVPEFEDSAVDLIDDLVQLRAEMEGLEEAITDSEERIDELVYELYGLNDEEIAIVEASG